MIHGFSNGKIASVEEYLFDATLHGKSFDLNHCLDLAKIPISFDNQEVDAFVIDVTENGLIIQLVLPLKEKFDDKSNVYKTSHIRRLLNSNDFLSRFNKEFIEHIKPTIIHTEDYATTDKLWLLSHEEISRPVDFLKTNDNCWSFDLFEHVDLQSYSNTLLKLNKQHCYGWSLRSADADIVFDRDRRYVSCVYGSSIWSCACSAYNSAYSALLPACTIC